MENKNASSNGIGFTGLLTIVFITLKLLNIIDWSWWWIFSPIWIPVLLIIVFLFLMAIIAYFSAIKRRH